MTDVSASVAVDNEDADAPRGSKRLWIIIAAALLLTGAGGGGAWYFFIGRNAGGETHAAPKPLPFFLDLKAFVVTVGSNSGQSRFIQLGASLQLTGAGAGEQITAVLPRVQDAMRQTMLTFKADDMTSPDGVNKVRRAMTKHLNEVLLSVLGAERFKEAAGGEPELVQNIYFPTLVVE